ncbi:hypothetical protein HKCCSP123_09240 [Rhodobacterales bacterium HKCCSP123]|nr:hypothetical protein [Rhodobacterales bacterium HKCCSP123]
MGLKKLADKVVDYNERLEQGKAKKIKPAHVRKVLEKLRKNTVRLEAEIAAEDRSEKKARLKRKLRTARELVERAEWLLDQID